MKVRHSRIFFIRKQQRTIQFNPSLTLYHHRPSKNMSATQATTTATTTVGNIDPNTLFRDRLLRLTRTKRDGEEVDKGSTDGLNVVRLLRGEGCGFVIVSCSYQELLRANLQSWPFSVSEDGLRIALFLTDYSAGRNGYRRKFSLCFFDEAAALTFFDTVVSSLPAGVEQGRSYMELRHGIEEVPDEEEGEMEGEKDGEEEEVDEENKVGLGGVERTDSTEDSASVNSADGDVGEDKEEEDVEELSDEMKEMLALEQDEAWGNSQALFNPIHPGDF